MRDGVDPGRVRGITRTLCHRHRRYRRMNVRQVAGQVAQLDAVTGAFHRATFGMAQHHDCTGPGNSGRELHAAQQFRRHHVAGNARTEDVTQALVKHQLRWHPGVDTAEHYGVRVLAGGGGGDLVTEIPLQHFAGDKTRIARLQQFQGVGRSKSRLGRRGLGNRQFQRLCRGREHGKRCGHGKYVRQGLEGFHEQLLGRGRDAQRPYLNGRRRIDLFENNSLSVR